MMKGRWLALCMVVVTSVPSLNAFAQQPEAASDADKASARALFFKGHAAFEAKDFSQAARLFKQSDELYQAPTALLWLGRSLAESGKLVEAQQRLREAISRKLPANPSAGFLAAVKNARTEADALQARLPSVVITAEPTENVTVTIDGVAIPSAALGVSRFVDPGQHIVNGTAPNYLKRSETITLTEGQRLSQSLALVPDPNATTTPKPNGDG